MLTYWGKLRYIFSSYGHHPHIMQSSKLQSVAVPETLIYLTTTQYSQTPDHTISSIQQHRASAVLLNTSKANTHYILLQRLEGLILQQ